VNRYALFSGLATRMVRPGGVVVLVIPASFLTGPLFAPLREHFRRTCHVEEIVMLASRDGAFLDVTQDACVLTLTRASADITSARGVTPFAILSDTGELESRGVVEFPSPPGAPWRLPGKVSDSSEALFTLENYGVEAKSGYFVWNREVARMTTRHSRNAVPLIWAENIRPGSACWPAARRGHGVDFVTFSSRSDVVIRESAIVMQRTTNNRQSRRLVAAVVPSDVIKRYGGFISENHTIVIRRKDAAADLGAFCALLGTEAVDQEFRRLSTGAHVSVTALRSLRLPDPHLFSTALRRTGDPERAAAEAYRAAESPGRRHPRVVASR
jgi:adenine-specific DNA-methyltransferase